VGARLGLGLAASSLDIGDASDVMGGGGLTGPNAPHRLQLGWLPDSAIRSGSAGTATLAPLGTAGALQVGWMAGLRAKYFVSYVRRIDAASDGLSDTFADKVLVHSIDHSAPNDRYPPTMLRAVLGDGESFEANDDGVRISAVSHDGSGATVSLASGEPSCQRGFPLVTVAPQSQSGPPGSTLTYTVEVDNTDSGDCGSSVFRLQTLVRLGDHWSAALDDSVLAIAPGANTTTTLHFTSPAAASPGDSNTVEIIESDDVDPYDHFFAGSVASAVFQLSAP
jgi:hypothetical protein